MHTKSEQNKLLFEIWRSTQDSIHFYAKNQLGSNISLWSQTNRLTAMKAFALTNCFRSCTLFY